MLCFSIYESFSFQHEIQMQEFDPTVKIVSYSLLEIPTPNISFSSLHSSFLGVNYAFALTQPESSSTFQLSLGAST